MAFYRFAFYNRSGEIVLRLNRHALYLEVFKKRIVLMEDCSTGAFYEIDSHARLVSVISEKSAARRLEEDAAKVKSLVEDSGYTPAEAKQIVRAGGLE